MGTIAARDALRVLELTEQVAAGLVVSTVQALRLRKRSGEIGAADLPPSVAAFLAMLEEAVPFIEEDRPLDHVLHRLCADIAADIWPLDWAGA